MISLGPIKEKDKIFQFFKDKGFEYSQDSGCVTAESNMTLLGYCLYNLDNKRMTVLYIEPTDDLPLADGILRSTLHIAAQRSITKIFYSEKFEEIYEKLGFIKSKTEKTLNLDLLFSGCTCCKKD